MGKNLTGIERGDVLVARGLVYIYDEPGVANLDLEVDKVQSGQKFGVATGVVKNADDGFQYTEMVIYFESNSTDKYDLGSKKYYVLTATYAIEENPDYDYTLNKKKTIGQVATGIGTGFNKVIDLLSGIFTIFGSKKTTTDTSGDTSTGDTTDTTASNGDSASNETWFSKNKVLVIVVGVLSAIVGILVYVSSKEKKKAKAPIQIAPTL